jgi:hypothetical protein
MVARLNAVMVVVLKLRHLSPCRFLLIALIVKQMSIIVVAMVGTKQNEKPISLRELRELGYGNKSPNGKREPKNKRDDTL